MSDNSIVTVVVAHMEMTAQDVLNLKVGDTLETSGSKLMVGTRIVAEGYLARNGIFTIENIVQS